MNSTFFYIVLLPFIIMISGLILRDKRRWEQEQEKIASMTPEEKQMYEEQKMHKEQERQLRLAEENQRKLEIEYGAINTAIICPHCQTKGKVHAKYVKLKKGLSGAKATGAILTGGLSILAVGLSRKEDNTQAHCDNCNSTWIF
ncbi:MAG: hypothetical protein Q8L79_16745 [Methylobacter sp.]|uniref:hypothetical protein n=1 Tax=Methylobacter sp. TaxID=2051955 RepID=UPI00273211E9|nr:hypothetical protein [Methylobacter sp.]MDP1666758.1 hypothetical protein [Methylobacter sp.]